MWEWHSKAKIRVNFTNLTISNFRRFWIPVSVIRILSHQLDLRFLIFLEVQIRIGSVQISVMLELARYYLVKITCFYSWYELVRKSRGCNTSTGVILWYFVRVRVSTQIRIRHKTHVTPPDDSVLFKHNIYRYLSGSCMSFQDTNYYFSWAWCMSD